MARATATPRCRPTPSSPATPRRERVRPAGAAAFGALGLLLAAGGCTTSLTQSDQVIVRLIGVDVDGARPIAQAECTRRGAGQARFVAAIGNASGARSYDNPDPPDAVFICERR